MRATAGRAQRGVGQNFPAGKASNVPMGTPYRDDFDAAQERLSTLEQELAGVKTRARELASLQRDEGALQKEIAALRSRLDGMAAKRSLPLLDRVRIASPCKADWDRMQGDDKVRFCAECGKDVFNLSRMAREEAEAFVREQAGGACIRLYRRADGTVLTSDCPVGLKRKRLRNVVLATVGSGMLAAGALFGLRTMGRPSVAMGDFARPEPAETAMGGMWAPPSAAPEVPVTPAPPPKPAAREATTAPARTK